MGCNVSNANANNSTDAAPAKETAPVPAPLTEEAGTTSLPLDSGAASGLKPAIETWWDGRAKEDLRKKVADLVMMTKDDADGYQEIFEGGVDYKVDQWENHMVKFISDGLSGVEWKKEEITPVTREDYCAEYKTKIIGRDDVPATNLADLAELADQCLREAARALSQN